MKVLSTTLVVALAITSIIQFTTCRRDRKEALIDTGEEQLGKIQGSYAWAMKGPGAVGRKYYWFTGIPYAKPESYTGNNRFKPSELWDGKLPDDTGDGTFLANESKSIMHCPQLPVIDLSFGKGGEEEEKEEGGNIYGLYGTSTPFDLFKSYYSREGMERRRKLKDESEGNLWGKESCLIVTVSTPKLPSNKSTEKLPVIVFIHGGSFDAFWGSIFGGQRLMNHDVVFVSLNYRLGVLGSLNLGIEEAPGNAAVYDCINALKWVQKYIHHFGGDKDRVTLTGQSAGAVLATTIFLSPLAKGLFHGVIGDSGSALSVWANQLHPVEENMKLVSFSKCKDLLPKGGRKPDDKEALAITNCMKSLSLWDLVAAREKYCTSERLQARLGYDVLVPSVQKASLASKIPLVLDMSPREILRKGLQSNVPLIMGATRHDGSFVLASTFYEYLVANGLDSDANFIKNDLFPTFLKGVGMKDPSGALVHSLQKAYLGDASNSDDILSKLPGILDIYSAIGFKAGAYGLVEEHSRLNNNSFYYAFEYKGLFTAYEIAFGRTQIPGGVGHVDDLLYLFQLLPLITQQDWDVSDRWVKYWVNFATYGNPNGPGDLDAPFPRYNSKDHRFLVINATDRIGYHVRDTWYGNSEALFR